MDTLGFAYDGTGKRVTFTNNPGTGVVTDSYAYPASSNQQTTVTLGAGDSRVFTCDAMGDVTNEARTGGAYSYTYDNAGRMATFSIGGVLQASYKYDFAGRQVIRALTSPTAVTIHSVFDSDGNRIAEYNEATGALIREYVWLNGEALAVIEGGVVNYIRVDHIGRPVFATNSAGTKTWTATYLPFGEVRTTTGTPVALRFPGQWFQSESGLHQNWMRDYDPTTGRYIEADPLGLVDGASIYGYVKQNPGRWTDRRGEESWICDGKRIAGFPVGAECGNPTPEPQPPKMCSFSDGDCHANWEEAQVESHKKFEICMAIAGSSSYRQRQCAREDRARLEDAMEEFLRCIRGLKS